VLVPLLPAARRPAVAGRPWRLASRTDCSHFGAWGSGGRCAAAAAQSTDLPASERHQADLLAAFLSDTVGGAAPAVFSPIRGRRRRAPGGPPLRLRVDGGPGWRRCLILWWSVGRRAMVRCGATGGQGLILCRLPSWRSCLPGSSGRDAAWTLVEVAPPIRCHLDGEELALLPMAPVSEARNLERRYETGSAPRPDLVVCGWGS